MIPGMIINGCAACAVHTRQRLHRLAHCRVIVEACENYYYYALYDSDQLLCHPPIIIIIMWGLDSPISCRVNFMQITPYLPCSRPKYQHYYVHMQCSQVQLRVLCVFFELRFENSAYTVSNCSLACCFPSANRI